MPHEIFHEGDICWLKADICNMDDGTLSQVPFFVLLDVAGLYFFYPSWCWYPNECPELDYKALDVPPGMITEDILPEFNWPQTNSAADDLYFYGAMLDMEKSELIGDLGWIKFGFDS